MATSLFRGAPILIGTPVVIHYPVVLTLVTGTAFLGGSKAGHWYTVFVMRSTRRQITDDITNPDMYSWSNETYGEPADMENPERKWFRNGIRYYFRNESDREWFMLKWG